MLQYSFMITFQEKKNSTRVCMVMKNKTLTFVYRLMYNLIQFHYTSYYRNVKAPVKAEMILKHNRTFQRAFKLQAKGSINKSNYSSSARVTRAFR